MNMKKLAACVLAGGGIFVSGAASAVPLPSTGFFTYGNANSYSLPILAYQYDAVNGGGVGPGNPYYVNSTPGSIQDQLVIYTGSSGTGVTTNAAGFDDAYQTPNGKQDPYASIGENLGVVDPTPKGGIENNLANTWDANLAALKAFLDGGSAQFMFNNNDTNSDQNLAAWAKVWLTDGLGDVYENRFLYFSNRGQAYGAGGEPNGDATLYNPGNIEPLVGDLAATDMVLSGGAICVDAVGATIHFGACIPADSGGTTINHNLGANQAAYAIVSPLLDQWLSALFALADDELSKFTMHVDLRLGCATEAWLDCADLAIDNGYEQLFLTSSRFVGAVPEPSTIALLALSMLGMAGIRRRKA